jgi:hypothetical protein
MTRFRPSVEALDARTLPSAVFATADSATAGLYAETSPTAGESGDTVVAKVRIRDIHFTSSVSKSSP